MVKPAAQRKAVEHVRQLFAISERRACSNRSSRAAAHSRA
jgi:putative transposase